MTLEELSDIRATLIIFRSSESCANMLMEEEIEKCLEVIELELKQLEISNTNKCLCILDEDSRIIIKDNPACPIHGISAQLDRSQME